MLETYRLIFPGFKGFLFPILLAGLPLLVLKLRWPTEVLIATSGIAVLVTYWFYTGIGEYLSVVGVQGQVRTLMLGVLGVIVFLGALAGRGLDLEERK